MANTDTDFEVEKVGEPDYWSGAKEPFKASYGKLMMWYFLLSDAFTFAGFLIAYGTLRFSSETWPVPDFVFSTAPFGVHNAPLIFVTIMSFLLIISSVTMVRAVQEGHRENKNGVVFWMVLTIFGGLGFLGCQAWEWTNLIKTEHMTVTRNPFGTHVEDGVYLRPDGTRSEETFSAGESYLIHKAGESHGEDEVVGEDAIVGEEHSEGAAGDVGHGSYATEPGEYAGYVINEQGFILRKFIPTSGEYEGTIQTQQFGPQAFGALFFFITGFFVFAPFFLASSIKAIILFRSF